RDERDWPEPQLSDDGVPVTDLVGGGIRIAGRLIRTAPPEKVEGNDPARRREVRNQAVVEVQVVGEPVHQHDRRFLARVVADVDAVSVPLHESLLVGHRSLRKGYHLATTAYLPEPLKLARNSGKQSCSLGQFQRLARRIPRALLRARATTPIGT